MWDYYDKGLKVMAVALTSRTPGTLPCVTLTLAAVTAKRQLPAGDDAAGQVRFGLGELLPGVLNSRGEWVRVGERLCIAVGIGSGVGSLKR
jgi:hypothetical protein